MKKKNLFIDVDRDIHKKVKQAALDRDMTIRDYLLTLIRKDLKSR